MDNKLLTADEIYELALTKIAPLPCQESYLRELSAIVAFHLRKNALIDKGMQPSELPYQSAIVVAPTGAGKTFVLRELARMLDINTIVIDGSSVSRDGWKGSSFGQQLLAAKKACNDPRKFESSLVFIDEIDKARLWNTYQDQANVQDNVLQLYNNGTISVENGDRVSENLYVARFTVILGGAFSGLEKIIKRRVAPNAAIGFTNRDYVNGNDISTLLKRVTIEDIEKYGIKRELLGRVGSVVTIDPMQERDYRLLLTAENGSVQRRYRDYFMKSSGVDFAITDAAVKYICDYCNAASTGARAVNPIANDLLRQAIAMVDRDLTINKVILDADETGCILKYEHGDRTGESLSQRAMRKYAYMMRAKDIDTMVDKLVSFYKERPRAMPVHELASFLLLSLNYLKQYTRSADFCYASVEKLASATNKDSKACKSTYDIMIGDVLENPTHDPIFDALYEEFCNHWTVDYTHQLVDAVVCLRNQIEDQHQCSAIRFAVACSRTT